ncbi:MAG: 50S ribosomal protein L28 [Phycisphaerales bacterium]|nr:50S ribosomal protein L28 [Phycisphaerales bacterium]
MPRVCDITGVGTTRGNRVRYRGKAKYLGGIGKKVTSISRRTFKPNLQDVTSLVDGVPTKLRVSARAIKSGLVVKAPKRKHTYTAQQKKKQG